MFPAFLAIAVAVNVPAYLAALILGFFSALNAGIPRPKNVECIGGEVVKVDLITPARGMSGGVYLMLKTGMVICERRRGL